MESVPAGLNYEIHLGDAFPTVVLHVADYAHKQPAPKLPGEPVEIPTRGFRLQDRFQPRMKVKDGQLATLDGEHPVRLSGALEGKPVVVTEASHFNQLRSDAFLAKHWCA